MQVWWIAISLEEHVCSSKILKFQTQQQQPPPQLQQPQPMMPMPNAMTSNYVPQLIPTSVDLSSSAVTIDASPVTIVPYNSNPLPIGVNNPIVPTAVQDQSNPPNVLASIQTTTPDAAQYQTQSHEPPVNHLYASQSADQTTNYEKSPCINPNFSKIIELSVTPSPPPIPEEPSENSNDNSSVSSPYHTAVPTPISTAAVEQSAEPKIPISHLMATNQYPSLNRMPPANIVHSFAPVYNQSNLQSHHQQQQLHQHQQHGDELYSSYVNNPYNLTLDQNFANNQMADQTTISAAATPVAIDSVNMIQTQPNPSNLNVFQSINYFGASTDSTQIPPGSEVLFGGP